MGWNYGWTMMQIQVVELYNHLGENFTPEICKTVMKVYANTDMDEGGKDYNMFSKDGKEAEQIVVEILLPDFNPSTYKNEWMDMDDYETEEDKKRTAYSFRFDELMRDQTFWKDKHV